MKFLSYCLTMKICTVHLIWVISEYSWWGVFSLKSFIQFSDLQILLGMFIANHTYVPLYVILFFDLVDYNRLMCIGVFLFGSLFIGTYRVFWAWMDALFNSGKFSTMIYLSNNFSLNCMPVHQGIKNFYLFLFELIQSCL